MIFNQMYGTINRIWAIFGQSTGELKSVGTARIDIYSGTGTAYTIGTADMTLLTGGTGIYYYPFDTTSKLGQWNAVITMNDTGTLYKTTTDICVHNDVLTGDIERGLYTKGTFKIWNVYSNSTGAEADAGTISMTVYPNNSDTPHIAETVMTRHGTGLYYSNIAIGTNGNYTSIFKALTGTSVFGGVYQFSVVDGTTATGVPPTRVGTIAFQNGTSGTHAHVLWTPTNATGYTIYRSTDPFNVFTAIGATANGTYTDNTVTNNTEYHYYVVGTTTDGASLPSNIVYGFVYGTQYNYSKNAYQTLQSIISTNISQLKCVLLGETADFPVQLPMAMVIPTGEEEDSFSTTGQVDYKYKAIIRLYYQNISRDMSLGVTDTMDLVGLVKNLLETYKGNQPYWYTSDISEVSYTNTDAQRQLKYAEITWECTRRTPRNE